MVHWSLYSCYLLNSGKGLALTLINERNDFPVVYDGSSMTEYSFFDERFSKIIFCSNRVTQ
jgi:hypothetical protein